MEALFRRLNHYTLIGEAERSALKSVVRRSIRFDPGEDVVTRGEEPEQAFVVAEGWAARHVAFEDGRSQIINFMLPGDLYDLQVFIAESADHSITAITPLEILTVEKDALLTLFDGNSHAGLALWWCALQEEAILREQVVRNGRRSARERVAHILLELHRRAVIAGKAAGDSFTLPVSQALLSDALSLSFVHVNRVIRGFVNDGLLDRKKSTVTILDRETLCEIAAFDDDYLHLDAHPRRLAFPERFHGERREALT